MTIRTCQLSQFREENIKSEQLCTGVEMLLKRMNTTVQAVHRRSRFCLEFPTFRFSERFGKDKNFILAFLRFPAPASIRRF
jgi:hypothetical protein